MNLLDTVALRTAQAALGLPAGLVGVVVEEWRPGIHEVEFADLDGRTYARATLPEADLLPLRHAPDKLAA
jgi:hypothetical protein